MIQNELGMLYCAQEEWLRATIMFFISGMFRSNGVMLAGFLVYGMMVDPFIRERKVNIAPFPMASVD